MAKDKDGFDINLVGDDVIEIIEAQDGQGNVRRMPILHSYDAAVADLAKFEIDMVQARKRLQKIVDTFPKKK